MTFAIGMVEPITQLENGVELDDDTHIDLNLEVNPHALIVYSQFSLHIIGRLVCKLQRQYLDRLQIVGYRYEN